MSVNEFPDHLIDYLIEFIPQNELTKICYLSKRFYYLSRAKLYRRIYLNDGWMVNSKEYATGQLWSVLEGKDLKRKLQILINSLRKKELANLVHEIWLDQDLSLKVQRDLVQTVLKNGTKVQLIYNVFDRKTMEFIAEYEGNLRNFDIVPENVIPSRISLSFIHEIEAMVTRRKIALTSMTVFANPVTLFNKFEENISLKLSSLTFHLRDDKLFHPDRRQKLLAEIVDPKQLKSLTIICWWVNDTPELRHLAFLESLWRGLDHLEEVSFVSMVIQEEELLKFLDAHRNKLKRFRFHYAYPRVYTLRPIIQNLMSSQVNLRYLDINHRSTQHEFYWHDWLSNEVQVAAACGDINCLDPECQHGCECEACQYVKQTLVLGKLYPNHGDCTALEFESRNVILLLFRQGLLPYTFGFDRYPSFINRNKVQEFLESFHERSGCDLTAWELGQIYQTLLHHMAPSLEYFIDHFKKLEKLVINDIPFVITNTQAKAVFDADFMLAN